MAGLNHHAVAEHGNIFLCDDIRTADVHLLTGGNADVAAG